VHFDTQEQQLQADLLWAVTSADMMQLGNLPEAADLHSFADSPALESLTQWLHNQDHSTALTKLIKERQPSRLGIYYEALWQYVFEHYPGFQLICQNLPITNNSRTLGEMDFVYFCKLRQQHVHLETAVKFYLGDPEFKAPHTPNKSAQIWSQWIGPGCKDRLDIKLLKMLNKQTRLASTPEGLQRLEQLGITHVLREICLKGCFFYPLNGTCPPPPHNHPQHGSGYWLPQQDINLLQDKANSWHIMKKEQWLAPVTLPESSTPLTLNDLESDITLRLASNPFPIMVANMQPDVSGYQGSGYQESGRYFITPDDWPQPL